MNGDLQQIVLWCDMMWCGVPDWLINLLTDLQLTRILNCKYMTIQNGCTALMWALRYGHTAIATLLLELGASIDIADKVSGW